MVARVNRLIFPANQDTGSEQEVRLGLKSQSPPTVVHFLHQSSVSEGSTTAPPAGDKV